MGCFFSIFKFGTYVVKESEPNANTGSQTNVPEIRKHSSTPLTESASKPLQKKSAKPLLAGIDPDKIPPVKEAKKKDVEKEKTLYTTTFETQVDAAPPHPLEEKLQDIQLDEIEIDTNIFTPEVEDAVVKIQAGFRGYLARKHVHELKKDIEDSSLINDEEVPVVPPPKNFENQTLNSLVFTDLDKWKRLSQHLEEKVAENETPADESTIHPAINGRLTEAVIPLKDSDDNKVIETYVCKENILDVEPTEEQPVFSKIMAPDATVVDKVFNVLMSETESESIINFIETNKSKIEPFVEPIKEFVNSYIGTEDKSKEVTETTESEVLANLNAILDNNDTNVDNVCENIPKEDNSQTSAEEVVIEESFQSKLVEIVSQNTTQEIIRNSFHEFVKEMTESQRSTESEPKVEESQDVITEEPVIKFDESVTESQPEEPTVDERKTDSMIFEEEVVQSIFAAELSKSQTKNQIFAIEVFKDDVKEEQLANVTTLCEPEPKMTNMWGVEDKVCKTSIDQFVVKPVERQTPTEPSEEVSSVETLQNIPVLETEQKIEVQSRKNSEDLLESEVNVMDEPLSETEEEVLPVQSPIIQIEEQNGRILDEEEAAIRIQAAFRGYQIRRSMSREASPSRGTNHNNNNIDSNNNNHNNGSDIDFNDNEVQWVEPSLQSNNELSVDFTPSEQFLTTDEVSNDASNQLISTSVELIDTSLERLEDQLMQELISSEEEDRNDALLNDNLDTAQRLLDDMNSSELSAPLLLQRLQQSMSSNASNASNADSEEQVPEVPPISPETAPIDVQTSSEEQINRDVEFSVEEEDIPLIGKSDTIIMDLLSSSPQINNTIIDFNETNPNLIQSTIEDNLISDELSESEDVVEVVEERNDSPIIVSELLKDSKTESTEVKTQQTIEVTQISVDEVISQSAQTLESVAIIDQGSQIVEVDQVISSQTEAIESESESIESQPLETLELEIQMSGLSSEPLLELSSEPTPESVSEPPQEPQLISESVTESEAEPVSELTQETELISVSVPESEPVSEPTPESELNAESEFVSEPTQKPELTTESVPESEHVSVPTPEPVSDDAPELQIVSERTEYVSECEVISEPTPKLESISRSAQEPEFILESVPESEPVLEATPELVSQDRPESVTPEPVSERIEYTSDSELSEPTPKSGSASEPTQQPELISEDAPEQVPPPELTQDVTQTQETRQDIIESSKSESNEVLDEVLENLEQSETESEPTIQTTVEPPTPGINREITPELAFIRSSEEAVLTKICSSESEQEAEVMSSDRIVESRPSLIPVLESYNKPKSGEQTETVFKRPKPILKDKDSKFYTNIIPDEQTHSTSEEISSPDDDNPEFVGLGPNTPIPVRASSPNPFGKKRRRGKKGTSARK